MISKRGTFAAVCGIVLALAMPARAESVSLSCMMAGGYTRIINVDYTIQRVTMGEVADQGTRYGPYMAQISEQVIAWDISRRAHFTISRISGDLTEIDYGPTSGTQYFHYFCSPLPPPKRKF